jgi:hypothetical protein
MLMKKEKIPDSSTVDNLSAVPFSDPHWGVWCEKRALFVGILSHTDLAVAIGISREHTSVLKGKATPPPYMMPMTRRKMLIALKTDAMTLFFRYKTIAPDEAPLVDAVVAGASAISVAPPLRTGTVRKAG